MWSDHSPKSITTTHVGLIPVPGTAELSLHKNSLEIFCTLAACLDSELWVKYKTSRSHFRPLHFFFSFWVPSIFYCCIFIPRKAASALFKGKKKQNINE